jgi:ABC-2 type transport system permease protein
MAVGRIAFDVALPRLLPPFVLAFLLAAGALLAVGLLVAALVPSGRTATAVGSLLFFPLLFFAGLWLPRQVMPDVLRRISDFTPLGAGVQAMHDASAGSWPQPLHLAVMTGYLVVFGLLAARTFRWD